MGTIKTHADRPGRIFTLLKKAYPHAKIALNYSDNWQLLVAVILSAQCTDKRVNIVTRDLFKKYKTIQDYTTVPQSEFEQVIRSTGFFRNKATNIISAARIILEQHNGTVPKTMKEMLTIPGVARKTANVVLGNAYGVVEGIAVDTHVKRLSQRLGLTNHTDPDKIEQDLMRQFPKKDWFDLTYLFIEHGRSVCDAKKPLCNSCMLKKICPSAFKFPRFKNI